MKSDIDLIGDEQLAKLFSALPGAAQRRVLRPAIAAGARPVVKAAKVFAPVETRALKKSLGQKSKTYKSGVVAAIVGVRRGMQFAAVDRRGRKRVPAFYQHLVQLGTKPHPLGKGVTLRNIAKGKATASGAMHPGTKANPFLAKAWNMSKTETIAQVKAVVATRLPAEAKRLASR